MPLLIISRHAQSQLNLEGRVNGDPSVPVELTPQGVEEARRLGRATGALPIELCVHTRFPRTRLTAEIALGTREVPFREESRLDDIDIGRLDGHATEEYRAWKRAHERGDLFPGGESLDQARHVMRAPSPTWQRSSARWCLSSATRFRCAMR